MADIKTDKAVMTAEDREYFKNGVKTLCGTEMLITAEFIKQNRSIFTKEDYEFMSKELGRQAGAIWAKLLRALKKADFKEAQKILTGGNGK